MDITEHAAKVREEHVKIAIYGVMLNRYRDIGEKAMEDLKKLIDTDFSQIEAAHGN